MSDLVRWLRDVRTDEIALVGGKAANLGRLVRMGLPVPPGFVVTTEAYRAVLTAAGRDRADLDPEALRRALVAAPIPSVIAGPVVAAYEALGAPAVAVRSSGTAEDLAAASFAGQHDSFLDVTGPEAVLDAVRGCWASLWSPRAVDYRRRRGWDGRAVALAVVVQAMVPAEWAGVLFTADPVTGQRNRLVVEAVPGLGEALVSGARSGEHVVLDKASGRVLAGASPLPEPVLHELARLAGRIETAFGRPQDVEWAVAAGQCFVLQSRPMTALPDEPPHEAAAPRRYTRLQRAGVPNALEHMPVSPYPFDYSLFFRPALEQGRRALAAIGLALPPVEEIYVPLADGVVQMVPPAIQPTPRIIALPGALVRSFRAAPEAWLEECHRTLVAEAQRIDAEELLGISDGALLVRIKRLRDLQTDSLVGRFRHFPRGMLASQGLSVLLRRLCGTDAPRVEADLLAAIPCATTESNQVLARLARELRSDAALRAAVLEEPPERIADRLRGTAAGRDLLARLDAFLGRYGSRETVMPSAALPAWRDDPSIVYGLLTALVAGGPAGGHSETDDAERAERANQAAEAALGSGWFGLKRRLLLPLFRRLLGEARGFVAFREDSHFCLMGHFTVVRRLALELGRRLVECGALETPEDVFFLRIEELDQPGPPDAVWETVRRRKATRRSVEGRYTSVPADLLAAWTRPGEVRGVATSPGQAIGRVRVVLGERDFGALERGEVLVALYTNPAWTPLFGLAGAVVVDAGGAASHAAIVAREYGIPAVMGTGTATARLRTGQRVLVDGAVGRVVPLGEEGEA